MIFVHHNVNNKRFSANRSGTKIQVRKPRPGVRKPGAMWIPANVNWKFHLRPPAICPRVVAMENPSTSPMLHVALRMNTPRAMSRRLVWTRRLKATARSFLDLAGQTGAVGKARFKDGMSFRSVTVCSAWCPPPSVFFAPGARVRPSTNHWVSYQPTIGYLTNQLYTGYLTNRWLCFRVSF